MLEAHVFAVGLSRADARPTVLSLSGELDIASASELADAFASVARSDTRAVVVDLSMLTFIDSTGINVLAIAAREARARGGELVVAAPSGDVRSVLEIVRFGDIVALEESLPAAFERLGSAGAA